MTGESANPSQRAITTAISLYPLQDEIVRQFATETHRRYSNALQFIIEDWARMKRNYIQDAAPAPEPIP